MLSAIALDYDLSSTDSVNELRATLDVLKESADLEEGASSGQHGGNDGQGAESSADSSERARSWHGDAFSTTTEETEVTGLSQPLDSLDLGQKDPEQQQRDAHLEDLSISDKEELLKEMFPSAKDFDIKYTLKKTDYSFSRTVEELLNQAFLEHEDPNGQVHVKKGVEAFTEPMISGRQRRGRKKQKQLQRRTSSTPASSTSEASAASTTTSSRWDRAKEDIDFIAQRTFIPSHVITSIYHKSSASLHLTIAALCAPTSLEANPNPYLSMSSPAILEAHASELSVDFPRLSCNQIQALIKLTHPSTASAHELARALVSGSSNTSTTDIIPKYLSRQPSPPSSGRFEASSNAFSPASHSTVASLAKTRSTAFSQAQSAYRKSKSKPLMGGAAAYYSSVGRDASDSLRRHEAAAAESLVLSQSRPGEIDLHGVTVKDAVNITRVRVESWWESQGREWARQGKVMGGGLRVITGAGKHSEGGRGKLGPAVGAMLIREGWKVEVGNGVVEVVGRARK